MSTRSSSSATPIIISILPEKKSAFRRGGVLFIVVALLPLALVLTIGDFQIPFPIRGFNDISVLLLYSTLLLLFLGSLWLYWYLWQASTAQLELYSTEVRYVSPFFTVRTSWENIERIGPSSSGIESFLLREPAILERTSRLLKLTHSLDAIPLPLFGKTYGADRLAEALRLWAPHLIRSQV